MIASAHEMTVSMVRSGISEDYVSIMINILDVVVIVDVKPVE